MFMFHKKLKWGHRWGCGDNDDYGVRGIHRAKEKYKKNMYGWIFMWELLIATCSISIVVWNWIGYIWCENWIGIVLSLLF